MWNSKLFTLGVKGSLEDFQDLINEIRGTVYHFLATPPTIMLISDQCSYPTTLKWCWGKQKTSSWYIVVFQLLKYVQVFLIFLKFLMTMSENVLSGSYKHNPAKDDEIQ